ncbi:MAG TPA: 4-hydroxy-tetrahydrodipicolinate reductase [Bacteroidales bacterium]|nr:4-hydroxy-tetrahydrodipicolinate reductase [Bacteroidales bacterium]
MKIALIGYGKMGKEIHTLALKNNIDVVKIIDVDNYNEINNLNQCGAEVAIEFTTPTSVMKNIEHCFKQNMPIVSGTTGWHHQFKQIEDIQKKYNGKLFYASNFSIGVNLFFKMAAEISPIMKNYLSDYHVKIEETHHTQKKDKPSGTAITLSTIMASKLQLSAENINIESFRIDDIVGNHKAIFDSDIDTIILEHNAKNRRGFAIGAIEAAKFLLKKNSGIYTMNDLIQ